MRRRRAPARTPAPSPSPEPVEPRSLGWPGAIALFLLALAVRVAVARSLASEPLFRSPQLDALEYLRWARLIAGGEFPWPVPPPHGLGYPVFLAGVLRLVDGSLDGARLAQAALGGGTVVLTGLLAARTFGRRAGWAAGALLAVMGPVVFTEVSFLGEGLLLFLLVAAFAAGDVAGGLLLGAAVLVRPTALVALPALLWKRPPAAMARTLLGCLVVVVPVVVRISLANGAIVPVQGYGGLNFHIGNDLAGDGTASRRLGGDWEALQAEPSGWFQRTVAELAARPLAALGLWTRKAAWTLQSEEIRDSHAFAFFQERSVVLRLLPGFGLLLGLGALGLWRAAREKDRRSLPPALALAAFLLVPVLLVVGSRYRLPALPWLAIFAGFGFRTILDSTRAVREPSKVKEPRRLAALIGVAALLWGFAQLGRHEPTHDPSEEWAMTGAALESLGERQGAIEAYRAALERHDLAPATRGLGRMLLAAGDVSGAETLYLRLIDQAADADVLLGLARVRGAQGRFREGLELAERAATLDPTRLEGQILRQALRRAAAGSSVEGSRALDHEGR